MYLCIYCQSDNAGEPPEGYNVEVRALPSHSTDVIEATPQCTEHFADFYHHVEHNVSFKTYANICCLPPFYDENSKYLPTPLDGSAPFRSNLSSKLGVKQPNRIIWFNSAVRITSVSKPLRSFFQLSVKWSISPCQVDTC